MTTEKNDMKTIQTHGILKVTNVQGYCMALSLCILLSLERATTGQTIVCPTASGTWTPAGNPYIVACDSTVPAGQTLTIQPGVIVWMGSNCTLTANGSVIQAVGTPNQRITFQAPSGSQSYWNKISLINWPGTNRFKYCDFVNARTGIDMRAYSAQNYSPVLVAEIMNCTFSNCLSQAVYGEGAGNGGCCWWASTGTIIPVVKNCYFKAVGGGCRFWIGSQSAAYYGGKGYARPAILNNVFCDVTNAAISMEVGESGAAGSSPATLINNTLIRCGMGVSVTDPWDARVQDNIFVAGTNAVKVSGSLTRTVSYNGFFGNATNFTGLPPSYGGVVIVNRNGTPCDLFYNIFQNPLFVATDDFHLAASSPCIDAGTPDWAWSDMCFPPSQGTMSPDLGAYAGSDACNWLSVVPKLPVQSTMSKSNNLLRLSWGALPRSEYQVQYLTNFTVVGTNNWLNFPNGKVLATEKPTSLVVATNGSQPKMFFRVKSLGRTAGN